MKKFILGLICGIGLTATTAVYASDTLQTYLFPVKFFFNSQAKEFDSEYTTLNYSGHAYVPVRWVVENMGGKVNYDDIEKTIYISTPTLESVPAKYPRETAVKNGDIVYFSTRKISTLDNFENFIRNVFLGKQDWLRITRYTLEGDPIIQQLSYNGDRILYQYDTTRDAYGTKEIRHTYCSKIEKEKNEDGTMSTYFLSGCDGSDERIVVLRAIVEPGK